MTTNAKLKPLYVREIEPGEWEWQDNSGDYPTWYPLMHGNTLQDVQAEFRDTYEVFVLLASDTLSEPCWNGKGAERWP